MPVERLDPDVALVGVGKPNLVRPFDHICMSSASVRPLQAEPLEPLDELTARDRGPRSAWIRRLLCAAAPASAGGPRHL